MTGRLVDARSTLEDLLKQLADKQDTLSPPLNEDVKDPDRTSTSQPSTPRKRSSSSGNRTPRKRSKRENPPQDTENQVTLPAQKTYIHELRGRSVDFAKFNKDTSLYVLARAWMKNKPHEAEEKPLPEFPSSLELSRSSDVVNSLPPPVGECRPYSDQIPQFRNEIWDANDFHEGDGPGASDLLSQHMSRWKDVRRRWKDASHSNQRRYTTSIQIIRKHFKE
ncbi:protein lin-37 homolog [Dendronephthya gigantea]|uniref:protein lin-37 homolog n=1 Tax=Dendronephthya gigantea TaxID=151771 RepID=UPI00106A6798|nr:protein lin-37 homolog [Dendronephthya gigantea]